MNNQYFDFVVKFNAYEENLILKLVKYKNNQRHLRTQTKQHKTHNVINRVRIFKHLHVFSFNPK